ncbi:hypothetical protein AB0451_34550 [Streptomyces sp. NPDC052000]|uniref:hypothetical protein n=1 Tax=Streptomyces sp. NPDC052000 TaxID=3155676 RepID=UPI00344B947F
MFRIISTVRLAELENLASAFPLVRRKCDSLDTDLDTERHRSERLAREVETTTKKFEDQLAAAARETEHRLATAGRSARLTDQMLGRAQQQAKVAGSRIRALENEVQQLKAKLAKNPAANAEGVVARYENLVGAPIDLTLFVLDLGSEFRGSKVVRLRLVSACSGCGYKEDTSSEAVYDSNQAREDFLSGLYEGGMLKTLAQKHAETCRAVVLPALVTN